MSSEKAVLYKTDRNHLRKEFKKAGWLTLLFGYGFLVMRKLNKQLEDTYYKVYDDRIVLKDPSQQLDTVIKVEDLTSVKRTQSPEQSRFGLCDLHLHTKNQKAVMLGIKMGEQLEDVLYIAIEKEKRRKAMQERAKGDYTDYRIGGLENMNDLVGMWQQGLISDEDFQAEQRKNKNRPD